VEVDVLDGEKFKDGEGERCAKDGEHCVRSGSLMLSLRMRSLDGRPMNETAMIQWSVYCMNTYMSRVRASDSSLFWRGLERSRTVVVDEE
jgi:hypothetical protein